MSQQPAQVAEYLLIALQMGVIEPSEAREWAFRQIEANQVPDGEMIEVAWSKTDASLETSLKAIPGSRDRVAAGQAVLWRIRDQLLAGKYATDRIVLYAMHTCQHADLGRDLYYELDVIHENLTCEELQGQEEECRDELISLLSRFNPTEKK